MNTLDSNRYTEAWRAFGAGLDRPRAVLVVSAHWYTNATAVTAMSRPRTIHDFYGFPDELFAFDYPAAGAPEVAQEVVEVVKPRWVGLDVDSWGLDHGTWSVLAHVFPEADVPVVQLSINALEPLDYHLEIGRRLAPLRSQGVLVLASGNLVHNLRAVAWDTPTEGFDWARRFDDDLRERLSHAPGDLLALAGHADYRRAVPTPDHFIPLLHLAALAEVDGEVPEVLVDGFTYGSISMTSYTVGCARPEPGAGTDPVGLPAADAAPPDQSNI